MATGTRTRLAYIAICQSLCIVLIRSDCMCSKTCHTSQLSPAFTHCRTSEHQSACPDNDTNVACSSPKGACPCIRANPPLMTAPQPQCMHSAHTDTMHPRAKGPDTAQGTTWMLVNFKQTSADSTHLRLTLPSHHITTRRTTHFTHSRSVAHLLALLERLSSSSNLAALVWAKFYITRPHPLQAPPCAAPRCEASAAASTQHSTCKSGLERVSVTCEQGEGASE